MSCSAICRSSVLPSHASGSLERVEVADDRLGHEARRRDHVAAAIGADEMRASRRKVAQHVEIDRAAADDDEEAIELSDSALAPANLSL